MSDAQCSLCQAEKAIRGSHVLSEFMYLDTYDSKHTAVSVSSHPLHKKPLRVQKGIREPILGTECEQRFSRHEHYAAPFLARAAREADAVALTGSRQPVARVRPFEYDRFKLFGLSLLWRMGVSRNDMFRPVQLGPHQEILRRMLLTDDPGSPSDYPFVLVRIAGVDFAPTLLTGPGKTRFGGVWSYMLTAMGFQWCFLATRQAGETGQHLYFVGNALPELIVPIHRRERGEYIQELLNHIPGLRRQVELARRT
jgi:hypothetical protein